MYIYIESTRVAVHIDNFINLSILKNFSISLLSMLHVNTTIYDAGI